MKAAIVYSDSTEISADNQDTLVQMKEISIILNALGIETQSFVFCGSLGVLEQSLRNMKPDFIFNLVETVNGTDSLIYLAASFFEYMQIPYTGCTALSLALLSSKIKQKKILLLAGLPTADFFYVQYHKELSSSPWIVKSDTEHASLGMDSDSIVETLADAKKKIHQKEQEFGGSWFVERYIDGREFNISMLDGENGETQLLSPAEILFENLPESTPKIVDYAAKWNTKSDRYRATPRNFNFKEGDKLLLIQLSSLSRKCWDLFGLNGSARVDFRVDIYGKPWILEVNANPCLTSDAGFMAAAHQAKLTPQEVIKRLLPAHSYPSQRV